MEEAVMTDHPAPFKMQMEVFIFLHIPIVQTVMFRETMEHLTFGFLNYHAEYRHLIFYHQQIVFV